MILVVKGFIIEDVLLVKKFNLKFVVMDNVIFLVLVFGGFYNFVV